MTDAEAEETLWRLHAFCVRQGWSAYARALEHTRSRLVVHPGPAEPAPVRPPRKKYVRKRKPVEP